jgi:hypothetical protein
VLWDILVSILWFMLLFSWIWLLVMIVGDLFRDHELSGWGKASWVVLLFVMPWLGALIYMAARGRSMNKRAREQAARDERELGRHVRRVAASAPSTADELTKLGDLRDRGVISLQEFARAKERLLGTQPAGPAGSGVASNSSSTAAVTPRGA